MIDPTECNTTQPLSVTETVTYTETATYTEMVTHTETVTYSEAPEVVTSILIKNVTMTKFPTTVIVQSSICDIMTSSWSGGKSMCYVNLMHCTHRHSYNSSYSDCYFLYFYCHRNDQLGDY